MPRKPDPTRATRKTGNRPKPGEAKPAVEVVPVTGSTLPQAPPDLPPAAREMFDRVVAELWPRGLREADLESVAMLCHSAWIHREARAGLAKHGLLVKGPRGPMVNPLQKVARDEAATYLRLANEFGLTIGARMRLGLLQLAGESILDSMNRDLDRRPVIQVEAGN